MSKARRLLRAVGIVLWHRLPNIAITSLALLIIILSGREIYRALAPGEWYLSYSSFSMGDGIETGRAIPIQACTSRDYVYTVDGHMTIFHIPHPQSDERHIVKIVEIKDLVLPEERCINTFLQTTSYQHPPGHYQTSVNLHFKVGSHDKQVSITSNIYSVDTRKPINPQEIEEKIQELQLQIEDLRTLLSAYQSTQPPRSDFVDSPSEPQRGSQAPNEPEPEETPPTPPQRPPERPMNSVEELLNSILGLVI